MNRLRVIWLGVLVTLTIGILFTLYTTVQAGLSGGKIVHGLVKTNTGEPVKFALVVARRIDRVAYEAAVTDADGAYEMVLSAGLWALTPRKGTATHPRAWIYPSGPQIVHFDFDDETEKKRVNFHVIAADAGVTGVVEMPDGSAPPFGVTVKLRRDEGQSVEKVVNSADGRFTLEAPHGSYALTVDPDSADYAGPQPLPVHLETSETLDVGTLTLLPRDVIITGTVNDDLGAPVTGVAVNGRSRHPQGARDRTDDLGQYSLAAFAGTWRIFPSVPYSLPFIFTGKPVSLTVAAGDVVTNVDFALTPAPNLLVGQLVDEEGQPVAATGHAHAFGDGGRNGGPLEGESFRFYLPDGGYKLRVDLAPGSGWLPGKPIDIFLSGGETVTVEVPLKPQDAAIVGALWEPRREQTVSGVDALVRARSTYAAVGMTVNPGNGTYRLGVGAGLWRLGYRVDPASGFVALDRRKIVPLESEQTLGVPLPVARRDSEVSGIVLDPAGEPLSGAVVTAGGLGPIVDQLRLRATSDATGAFTLKLPHGHYALWASANREEWLNPAVHHVGLRPQQTVAGIRLQFREPDAVLSGTTGISGTQDVTGTVHIWAYTMDGAAQKTSQNLGETYTLDLSSGSRWHIGAALADGLYYYALRSTVDVTTTGQTLDLVLDGPFPLPGPVAITFDADETAQLNLVDGSRLTIPAGALPVSGPVTLHATPIATFPHQHHARLYKYGYAFIAVDESGREIKDFFNQEVEIIFTYEEEALAALGLDEEALKPAYFSTTADSWTVPDSYIVDPDHNEVTLYIDHFTDYSLLVAAETHVTRLPVISR